MHICLLNRTFCRYRGGVETFTATLANFLAREGHIVHILAEQAREPVQEERLEPSVYLHTFCATPQLFKGAWRLEMLAPMQRLAYARAVAAQIIKLRETFPIEVIEAPASNLESIFMCHDSRNRVILRFHGGDQIVAWHTGKMRHSFKQQIARWLQKREIRRAVGLIAVSHSVADFAASYWGIRSERIHVIHNGIELPARPSTSLVRQHRILFVGLLHESKGIGVLADAIRILEQRKVFADFVIIGSESHGGCNESSTEKNFKDRGYRSNVVFTGLLPAHEVVRYYQTSTILVMPSLYEPFGLVAIEAMASGCVVIASRTGGLAEIIEHGVNGLLVETGNPTAWADAIERLWKHPELRDVLGSAGPQRVLENFQANQMAQKSLAVYAEVLL